MKWLLSIVLLVLVCLSACLAQGTAVSSAPKITGWVVLPVNANQCQAVQIRFTIKNESNANMYSQRPYTGTGYSLYQSFSGSGYRPLSDRYMIGVSLNGGKDGYPYRWGFRGALLPGRTTTIVGSLTLIELGSYRLTAMVMRGGTPVGSRVIDAGNVYVSACVTTPPPPRAAYPAQPVYPVYNGQYGAPPITPYIVNGYTYVEAIPFLYSLGGDVYLEGNAIILSRPGYELTLIPMSPIGYVNGRQFQMPMPLYNFGGVPYLPPRFVMPLIGGNVQWDPYGRQLYVNSPWLGGGY